MQEALALRERLVAATNQAPYYVKRLANAKALAESLTSSLT